MHSAGHTAECKKADVQLNPVRRLAEPRPKLYTTRSACSQEFLINTIDPVVWLATTEGLTAKFQNNCTNLMQYVDWTTYRQGRH